MVSVIYRLAIFSLVEELPHREVGKTKRTNGGNVRFNGQTENDFDLLYAAATFQEESIIGILARLFV